MNASSSFKFQCKCSNNGRDGYQSISTTISIHLLCVLFVGIFLLLLFVILLLLYYTIFYYIIRNINNIIINIIIIILLPDDHQYDVRVTTTRRVCSTVRLPDLLITTF